MTRKAIELGFGAAAQKSAQFELSRQGNPKTFAIKEVMSWIIALTICGLFWLLAKRAHGRSTELAATGLYRSPLFILANALAVVLLGLVLYVAQTHHGSPISPLVWIAIFAIIAALLVMRRALKWRYPF